MRDRHTDIKKPAMLAYRQHEFLCDPHTKREPPKSTLRALERKGYLARAEVDSEFTDKGRAYVKSHMDYRLARLQASEYPDAPVISDDATLKAVLYPEGKRQIGLDIRAAGDHPVRILRHGMRDPVAYLHPYLHWQIEREKSAGDFLERKDFLMNDMGYSYEMPCEAPAPAM